VSGKTRRRIEHGHSTTKVLVTCNETLCPHTYEELHLRDLLVHLFHKFNHEIYQLVGKHLFGVEVCNEEGNIEALHRLPAQDEE
jgi:hypothetical protein